MPYLCLLILSCTFLSQNLGTFKLYPKSYLEFSVSKKHYDKKEYSFYLSSITGNKKALSKKLKRNFKKYGLLHLLTPSGIHLSSVIYILKFSTILEAVCLLILFFKVFSMNSYFSLERVILFRFLHLIIGAKIKKLCDDHLQVIFILTLTLYVLFQRHNLSPLSLIYSFAFWGTILLFRDNKKRMFLFLNITLLSFSSVDGSGIKVLSLFINPFFTGLYTLVFPFLIFNYFINLEILNWILNFLLKGYLGLFEIVNIIDKLPLVYMQTIPVLIASIFLLRHQYKWALLILCLQVMPLEPYKKSYPSKNIINLNHLDKIKKTDAKSTIYFHDRKCRISNLKISCRKIFN